jgi:regulator of RNase E activity RraA
LLAIDQLRVKMDTWTTDDELFSLIEQELFTCVVGDVMDKIQLLHQYLPPQIRPLHPEMVLLGRAMPVLAGDVFQESVSASANPLMNRPFGLMFEALDDLKRNEVYISTGSSPRNAVWGEIMATRAQRLGARGALANGYVRDTRGLLRMEFPTFALGSYGQDSGPRYKVYDFRIPIEIGNVLIRPGDIIFGDIDGALVIPLEVEQEVFRKALEKVRKEEAVKQELKAGATAVSAYSRYGVF